MKPPSPQSTRACVRQGWSYRKHGKSAETSAKVDYRLLFTQRALDDLAEFIGHIAEDEQSIPVRFGIPYY